jgi:hypothetical protein
MKAREVGGLDGHFLTFSPICLSSLNIKQYLAPVKMEPARQGTLSDDGELSDNKQNENDV